MRSHDRSCGRCADFNDRRSPHIQVRARTPRDAVRIHLLPARGRAELVPRGLNHPELRYAVAPGCASQGGRELNVHPARRRTLCGGAVAKKAWLAAWPSSALPAHNSLRRFNVVVKPEIFSFGLPGVDALPAPDEHDHSYVKLAASRQLIARGGIVVLDNGNHFAGAVDQQVRHFCHFVAYMQAQTPH
jgi:hypothetical protein